MEELSRPSSYQFRFMFEDLAPRMVFWGNFEILRGYLRVGQSIGLLTDSFVDSVRSMTVPAITDPNIDMSDLMTDARVVDHRLEHHRHQMKR